MDRYEPTHLSIFDGSDAMLVGVCADHKTILLMNENGDQWDDDADHWKPLPTIVEAAVEMAMAHHDLSPEDREDFDHGFNDFND